MHAFSGIMMQVFLIWFRSKFAMYVSIIMLDIANRSRPVYFSELSFITINWRQRYFPYRPSYRRLRTSIQLISVIMAVTVL